MDETLPHHEAPVGEPATFVAVDATETPANPPFAAAMHPDDATAQCTEILANMHGSDDQRRKVVAALVERFAS